MNKNMVQLTCEPAGSCLTMNLHVVIPLSKQGRWEKKLCMVILMEQSASLPAVMSISGKTRIFLNSQRPRLTEHFRHQATGGAALRFRSVIMEMQPSKFQAKLFFSPLRRSTSLFCPFCKQVVRENLGKQQLQREPIRVVSSRSYEGHILEDRACRRI